MNESESQVVTHPYGGMYLSPRLAGVFATLLASALTGVFLNLWYLNSEMIKIQEHVRLSESANSTLPGALSRKEWIIEKQLFTTQLNAIAMTQRDIRTSQISMARRFDEWVVDSAGK